jgi:hypothetical protein
MTINLNGDTREASRLVEAALNIIVLGDMFSPSVLQAAANYIADNVSQADEGPEAKECADAIVAYFHKMATR